MSRKLLLVLGAAVLCGAAPSGSVDSKSARVVLPQRYENWPCNTSITASFLYWYATQDGMTLATSGSLQSNTTMNLENGAIFLEQPFGYDPGFKIGIGAGYDEWEAQIVYTWLRQSTSVNANSPTNNATGGSGVWLTNSWFAQGVGSNNNLIPATNITSSWDLDIDLIDATACRPYFQTERIVLKPFGGIREALIRQSLKVGATVPSTALTIAQSPLASQPIYSYNNSNSWGLGPIFGSSAQLLVGSGIRLEGHGSFSVLFTQYTSLEHSEQAASSIAPVSTYSASENNYNTIRPMAELGVGISWESYIQCSRYYVKAAANYDFNVFWNQNMLRTLVDRLSAGPATSNDLFLHGLTLTGTFNF